MPKRSPASILYPRILLPCLLLLLTLPLHAGPRDAQWKQVEEAIKKGLPKTAITNLEPIIQGALKDKAYAEAVKAIGQKIALEGNIQGNKPEEKITRLEAEIAKAPKEMVPLLDTLLAALVLAILPAEPLAFHAAHRHRRRRPARISPPGTAAAVRRD